jgi:hypothetical protein
MSGGDIAVAHRVGAVRSQKCDRYYDLPGIAILTDQSRAVDERPSAEPVSPPLRQSPRFARREGLRCALEEGLDLVLQRAPIEAGSTRLREELVSFGEPLIGAAGAG